MSNQFIFNTPHEIGLRALYVLNANYPQKFSLERLILFDYLIIFSKDAAVGSTSLHPEYPMRTIELYERRETLSKGLLMLSSKGIIEIEFEDGISYIANTSTQWFLDGINNEYSNILKINAKLIAEAFEGQTDIQIKQFIQRNIDSWGSEFDTFFSNQEVQI